MRRISFWTHRPKPLPACRIKEGVWATRFYRVRMARLVHIGRRGKVMGMWKFLRRAGPRPTRLPRWQ